MAERFMAWLRDRYAPSTAASTLHRVRAAFHSWQRDGRVKEAPGYRNALQRLARYSEEHNGDLDGFPQEFVFGVEPVRGDTGHGAHVKNPLTPEEWTKLRTHLLNLETDEGWILAHYMEYGGGPVRTYLRTPISNFGRLQRLKDRMSAMRTETPEELMGRTNLATYARLRRYLSKHAQDVLLRDVDLHTLDVTRRQIKAARAVNALKERMS